jgi:hypothetical protein
MNCSEIDAPFSKVHKGRVLRDKRVLLLAEPSISYCVCCVFGGFNTDVPPYYVFANVMTVSRCGINVPQFFRASQMTAFF